MDEQNPKTSTPADEVPTGTEDYIEALKTLRSTTVPKTEYEKLKGENKKLLDTLVNGGSINPEDAPGDKRTVQEIRKELMVPTNFPSLWRSRAPMYRAMST